MEWDRVDEVGMGEGETFGKFGLEGGCMEKEEREVYERKRKVVKEI